MQDLYSSPPFDFDAWARLFVEDPQTFEIQRTHAIEQLIRQAPCHKQHRLRCLQWKLDQIRATAPSPLAASLRMNRLLWDSLAGQGGLIERLRVPHATRPVPDTGKVIPFPAGLSQPRD